MTRRILIVTLILLGAVVAGAGEAGTDLETLSEWMQGSFSSMAQAEADPDFFHIVLHMKRIWSGREDGIWLYVEQAAASSTESPYRQRVYHLRHVGEDLFASSVFSFPDPEKKVGAWKKETPFGDLKPADLQARTGCTIYLVKRADGRFEGSTLGRLCTSTHRGATWASSEVVVDGQSMISWDRGWDDAGMQVWGAEKSGYEFARIANPASK